MLNLLEMLVAIRSEVPKPGHGMDAQVAIRIGWPHKLFKQTVPALTLYIAVKCHFCIWCRTCKLDIVYHIPLLFRYGGPISHSVHLHSS